MISKMPNGLLWRTKCISGDQCVVLLGLLTCNWWFIISNHCFLKIIFKIFAKVIEPPYRGLPESIGWKVRLVFFLGFKTTISPTNAAAVVAKHKTYPSWNIQLYLDFGWNWTQASNYCQIFLVEVLRSAWVWLSYIAIDFSLYSLLTDTWIGARRLIQPSSNSKL